MEHQPLLITTSNGIYRFDVNQITLIKEATGKCDALGCGKIVVKSALKNASKTQSARIEISVERSYGATPTAYCDQLVG